MLYGAQPLSGLEMKSIRHLLVAILFLEGLAVRVRGGLELNEPPMAPVGAFFPAGEAPAASGSPVTLQVNPAFRAEVRAFFNAVFRASDGVPINSTASTATCFPGTNSPAFNEAVLRRINWFRAMAGVPATVSLDPSFSSEAQRAALMMSARGVLSHTPTNGWPCWTAPGSNAAYNCNLVLDSTGPDSITSYLDDFGSENTSVGHRRWMLYPQTMLMGSGDVPGQGSRPPANATWIFDGNFGGPRPATRRTEVAWPPAGFVPFPVVFRRWSFSYPGAGFSSATIGMSSNGVPIAVSKETVVNGYGENTVVWVPAGLNANSSGYRWPRPAADTTYSVTISNVIIRGSPSNFTYAVTVFDQDVAGAGEGSTAVTGPVQPVFDQDNSYSVQPLPYATRYEWRRSQRAPLVFFDGAEGGSTNFVIEISPGYAPLLAGAGAGGSKAYHLAHPQPPTMQTLTIKTWFTPATNGALLFKSRLGYSGNGQYARVQVSRDDGNSWADIYEQRGSGGAGETTFITRNLPLGQFHGHSLQLRFAYDFIGGNYFSQTNTNYGWLLDDVQLTNSSALLAPVASAMNGTNFYFHPLAMTNFLIEARGFMFEEFGLSWGPLLAVTPVVAPQLLPPVRLGGQWGVEFLPGSLPVSSLRLNTAGQVSGPWTINETAVLDTNGLTGRPRFTTPGTNQAGYFRLSAP